MSGLVRIYADEEGLGFEIAGSVGTAGLEVWLNPDGSCLLHPKDPAVGEGFALSPIATARLRRLLQAAAEGLCVGEILLHANGEL